MIESGNIKSNPTDYSDQQICKHSSYHQNPETFGFETILASIHPDDLEGDPCTEDLNALLENVQNYLAGSREVRAETIIKELEALYAKCDFTDEEIEQIDNAIESLENSLSAFQSQPWPAQTLEGLLKILTLLWNLQRTLNPAI
jgi:hypothetical protein